ncbi:HMG-box [Artomyces pyxidatus]|uniref:HMG-box n=1 Tax=Artomyces pyxidatus TaxID=48021 RepID=A0ACB8TLB8_9AGAM|nr:HMG-box [Artomyces pyxidatus]
MANQDSVTQLTVAKVKLLDSLNDVASSLRKAATLADDFSKLIANLPVGAIGAALPGYSNEAGKRKAEEPEEDGKKKRRVARKPKDPNAPRRPASSYIFFQNDIRKRLRSEFPDITYTEIMARISKMWGEMTLEQKEVYAKQSAAAKMQYEEEKKTYDARMTVAPESPPAARLEAVPETPVPVPATPSSSHSKDSTAESSEDSSEEDEDEEEEPPHVPEPKKGKTKGKAEAAAPAPHMKKGKYSVPMPEPPAVPATKEKKPKRTKA